MFILLSCETNKVEYDKVFESFEGMRLVVLDDKCGFINSDGELKVPLEYDSADHFSNNLARVYKRYKSYKSSTYEFRWGFVNKDGVEIIPVIYDSAEPFVNGIAKLEKDGKTYFFDNMGRPVSKSINDYNYLNGNIGSQINADYIERNNKKFIYVVIEISKPILKGFKPTENLDGDCYVVFVNEKRFSEVIEIENYNEDEKYKVLDKVQKEILKGNLYINQKLYGEAVVEYGYKAAEFLKNKDFPIKIINREVYDFNSYSEASKMLNNE